MQLSLGDSTARASRSSLVASATLQDGFGATLLLALRRLGRVPRDGRRLRRIPFAVPGGPRVNAAFCWKRRELEFYDLLRPLCRGARTDSARPAPTAFGAITCDGSRIRPNPSHNWAFTAPATSREWIFRWKEQELELYDLLLPLWRRSTADSAGPAALGAVTCDSSRIRPIHSHAGAFAVPGTSRDSGFCWNRRELELFDLQLSDAEGTDSARQAPPELGEITCDRRRVRPIPSHAGALAVPGDLAR
jgi:hypothetical protein